MSRILIYLSVCKTMPWNCGVSPRANQVGHGKTQKYVANNYSRESFDFLTVFIAQLKLANKFGSISLNTN